MEANAALEPTTRGAGPDGQRSVVARANTDSSTAGLGRADSGLSAVSERRAAASVCASAITSTAASSRRGVARLEGVGDSLCCATLDAQWLAAAANAHNPTRGAKRAFTNEDTLARRSALGRPSSELSARGATPRQTDTSTENTARLRADVVIACFTGRCRPYKTLTTSALRSLPSESQRTTQRPLLCV